MVCAGWIFSFLSDKMTDVMFGRFYDHCDNVWREHVQWRGVCGMGTVVTVREDIRKDHGCDVWDGIMMMDGLEFSLFGVPEE